MRFPSKGIGFLSGCRRGSAMTLFMPSSRTLREGQRIQEKTTVSSSLRLTAMGNDVTLPSGTSSPQHSAFGHIVPPALDEFQCAVLLEDDGGGFGMFLVDLAIGGGDRSNKSIVIRHDVSPSV